MMKVAAICLVSCVLLSLLPTHFSYGNNTSYIIIRCIFSPKELSGYKICFILLKSIIFLTCKIKIEEPKGAPRNGPVYCRSKQVFRGSCAEKGSPHITCLLDFMDAQSASVRKPNKCKCTPQPQNMRLCECQVDCDQGGSGSSQKKGGSSPTTY